MAPAETGDADRAAPVVLVVDDDPDVRKLVTEVLGPEGYVVATAADGGEAIELASSLEPDLVLLDIRMPAVDGYGVAEAIRRGSATAELPIVMVSALTGSDDIARARAAGADEYLTKPFVAEDLRRSVRSMLRAPARPVSADAQAAAELGVGAIRPRASSAGWRRSD